MRQRGHALSPLARLLRAAGCSGLPLITLAAPILAQQATTVLPPVEVIGTSPLPGQGIDRNILPYSTQSVRRARIDEAKGDNTIDFMNRNLPGVQVNDVQGSPYQGDVTYRGYRASPLLGAGQGLSVYLDGVRINEPFGDVVNWDLVPEFSIDSLTLVPGANPSFGLNSLGGALSMTTLSGLTAPGVRAEVSAGSFGRKRVDLGYGTQWGEGWHGYVAGSHFDEKGWRDHSSGHLSNVLAKFGQEKDESGWTVSLLAGRSNLVGNGLLPAYTLEEGEDGEIERNPDLYDNRRRAVYTHPDRTKNQLVQLAFNGHHQLDAMTELSALAYVRRSKRSTVNGDEAEEVEGDDDDDDDDDDAPNAAFNSTSTRQTGWGLAFELSAKRGAHQFQLGTTFDQSRTRYRQLERAGFFTDDRGVIPADEDAELSAAVRGKSWAFGLFGSDTWEVAPRTWLTGTVRYNRARVSNTLTSVDDDTGEVEQRPRETFTYNSVNPALGIAHRLEGGPTFFANAARNNRVPTVIELGCADPEEPCRLPAGLQADPYLDQVKSTTFEAGVRWPITRDLRLNVAAYRTTNKNDILFRSVSVNGQLGYFENFPRTRNQGVDAELQARFGPVDVNLGYSWLKATYEAEGVLRQGERNVEVRKGTRIAGLPRHSLKLGADWRVLPAFSLGGDVQAVSGRGASGNEDGRIEDGEDERVDVGLPGYAIVNLRASWKVPSGAEGRGWEIYAKVNNAFDKRYATWAAVAETQFSPSGVYTGEESDAVFVAPGAPRSVFVGLRYRY